MATVDTLNKMLSDIRQHNRKRSELIEYYVNARLDKSLKSYYGELVETYHMLTRRDAARVVRASLRGNK